MNRGKLLLVIVVILLLGAGVWWYWGKVLQPSAKPIVAPTISQSLIDSISNEAQQQGLPEGYLHANTDSLLALPEPNILSLKSAFEAKQSATSVPAEKSLLKTYISMSDLAIELKKLSLLAQSVQLISDVCDQQDDLQAFNDQLEKTQIAYETFAQQSDDFYSKFSYDAEKINFFPLSDSYLNRIEHTRSLIQENKAALELCS